MEGYATKVYSDLRVAPLLYQREYGEETWSASKSTTTSAWRAIASKEQIVPPRTAYAGDPSQLGQTVEDGSKLRAGGELDLP
ncbi:hypothetical protein V495_01975 [Pseudogymnoascus sp. VKM F-4514 (FW-929)]|nr:hypothetical protein V495_01975 [Pseudogymnoascus sp. VKM F-4514 (FW-929)]KFY52505.1 hypothetical protein V497_08511 [Pseudogymnoascus sp. VKM F-4516 (FW-969)]